MHPGAGEGGGVGEGSDDWAWNQDHVISKRLSLVISCLQSPDG